MQKETLEAPSPGAPPKVADQQSQNPNPPPRASRTVRILDWPSRVWSVGPSLSETIYDGGLRRATVNQYVATYNADLASYRQTLLTAFQQVEDALAQVRILSQQVEQQRKVVDFAQVALKLEMARYETGIDPYIDVVTLQTRLG